MGNPIAYEYSVGQICDALNAEQQALVGNNKRLATRLQKATTATTERNAILDSWNDVLGKSEHDFALFQGLQVPTGLATRARTTQAAWSHEIALVRTFVQRINQATTQTDLVSAVDNLPVTRTAIDIDDEQIAAGLIYSRW